MDVSVSGTYIVQADLCCKALATVGTDVLEPFRPWRKPLADGLPHMLETICQQRERQRLEHCVDTHMIVGRLGCKVAVAHMTLPSTLLRKGLLHWHRHLMRDSRRMLLRLQVIVRNDLLSMPNALLLDDVITLITKPFGARESIYQRFCLDAS